MRPFYSTTPKLWHQRKLSIFERICVTPWLPGHVPVLHAFRAIDAAQNVLWTDSSTIFSAGSHLSISTKGSEIAKLKYPRKVLSSGYAPGSVQAILPGTHSAYHSI